MIRIISNQKERALEWAKSSFPEMRLGDWRPDQYTALILEKDLAISGATFYNQWHPRDSIDIHCAAAVGESWLTRPFLRAAFGYPFIQLGVRRLGTLVAANNKRSLRFVRHLGFVEEGRAREGWAEGVDIVCFGMLRRECRYLDGPAPEIWSIESGQAERTDTPQPASNGAGTGAG